MINLPALGFMVYIVLIHVSALTTTFESFTVVSILRVLAAAMIGFIIITDMVRSRLKRSTMATMAVYIVVVAYGLVNSYANGADDFAVQSIWLDVILTLSGISLALTLFLRDGVLFSRGVNLSLTLFGLIFVLVTVSTGGIILSMPPAFNFEYFRATSEESVAEYSLGVSSYYGLMGIIASHLFSGTHDTRARIFYGLMTALFLSLCLLGGGRGEIGFATVIILSSFLAGRLRGLIVVAVVLGVIVAYVGAQDAAALQDIVFVQRFYDLVGGDLSYRDILFDQAIQLLLENVRCLILGCGMGYFQHYNAYEFSMYPHNIVMEGIISFGLPLTGAAIFLVVWGVWRYTKLKRDVDAVIPVYAFAFLVGLKSGYLLGSWLFIVLSAFFIAIAVSPPLPPRSTRPTR